MILAGDIGGTKTYLGLFDRSPDRRPRRRAVHIFSTQEFLDLSAVVSAFAAQQSLAPNSIDAASFGVAGPVVGDTAELTNVAWRADARHVSRLFGIGRVTLLNDLQAMAYGVTVLGGSEVHVLQEGKPAPETNMALIAAGTGLGEAVLHFIDGSWVPMASEGGHASFAARTDREIDVLRDLRQRYGHAEVEHVVSGRGLVNLYRMTRTRDCDFVVDENDADAPAAISKAGLEGKCRCCTDALNMFVDAYGAEAGNLALRSVALGGIFIGGGIAPKILPALTNGRFIRAFADKLPPFRELLANVPVKIILNEEAALVGAAVHAAANR